MHEKKRAVTTAVLATIAALLFLYSVVALVPKAAAIVQGDPAASEGITYTFDAYSCESTERGFVGCRWQGTVTDNGELRAQYVTYRDDPPPNVTAGTKVAALWTIREPDSAWAIESVRSWLGTFGSLGVSLVMLILLLYATIYWWRKVARLGPTQVDLTEKGPRKQMSRSD